MGNRFKTLNNPESASTFGVNLWFWLVLALAIRIYKIALVKCIATDGVAYIDVAKKWLTGRGTHPNWPPLYPWFISLLMRIGIEPELCGQLISCLFGVGTVALVYLVTRRAVSPAIAQTAAIFSVFHPYLVRYSAEVLSDSLFIFLLTSVIFCGWLGRKVVPDTTFLFSVLTGLLAGLCYLTKPEGIFLLVIISLWHRRLWQVFCMWLVFFVISFPYIYAIHEKKGEWMISEKQNIVFSVALQKEGLATEFLNISPWEYAKENPKGFVIKVGRGILSLLGRIPDAYHPLLFLFLIIGLVSGIKERQFLFYILTFLIPFFLGYAIFHPGRRYLVGWVPITLFLSAYGVRKLWILVLVTILVMLPKTIEPIRQEGVKWKEAGLWVNENSNTGVNIMSENIKAVFYAGREYISWEEGDFYKVDYIITEREIDLLRKVHHTSGGVNIYAGG